MSAWEGDVSDLGDLARNLEELARIPSRASSEAAGEIARLIDAQFDSGTDPYGEPWKPLAESTVAKKGDDTILVDTPAMRDSIEVRPMAGAGVRVTIGAEYAGFHQVGTKDMPKRAILPDADIPESWGDAIGDALDRAFQGAA